MTNQLGKPANPKVKLQKGFRMMDPALQREIASAGGKAAHAKGTAHQFTSEEAREAGKKSYASRRKGK